jgi:hypothetical protein
MNDEQGIEKDKGNGVLQYVSKRYCAGAIWHRYSGKDLIERIVESESKQTISQTVKGIQSYFAQKFSAYHSLCKLADNGTQINTVQL